MRTKKILAHPWVILLVLSTVLGAYKAATLRCISRDSVLFFEYSRQLGSDPGKAVESYDQHPGFPFLLLAACKGSESLCGELSIAQEVAAGQAVNLVCWIGALCLLFLIFQHFTTAGNALIQTLFVMAIPAYAGNASDVLSDWPALLFAALAFLFCLKGVETLRLRFFLIAGAASGAAYLIRPEGLVFAVATGLYVLLRLAFGTAQKRKLLIGLAILLASASIFVLPYMIYKGAIFPKKNVGTFRETASCTDSRDSRRLISPLYRDPYLPLAAAGLPKPVEGFFRLLEAALNVLFLLTIPWMLILVCKGFLFRRLNEPDLLLLIFTGLWLVLMIWLFTHAGYISGRHILPLVAFTFAWLREGIERLVRWFAQKPKAVQSGIFWFCVIAFAVFAARLVRPDRLDKAYYPEAGTWLREHTPADARLAVFDSRIGFYADRAYVLLPKADFSACDYLIVNIPRKTATSIPQTAQKADTGIARIDEKTEIYQLGGNSLPDQ